MIYFLRHPDTGLIKIGTTTDYKMRLSTLIRDLFIIERTKIDNTNS